MKNLCILKNEFPDLTTNVSKVCDFGKHNNRKSKKSNLNKNTNPDNPAGHLL